MMNQKFRNKIVQMYKKNTRRIRPANIYSRKKQATSRNTTYNAGYNLYMLHNFMTFTRQFVYSA